MAQIRARLAASLFPKYFSGLDKLNRNALVGQWIRDNRERVKIVPDKAALYAHVNATICHDEPIDYLEFGVYRGDTIRMWSALNTHPDSRFIGFDSFEGLPEAWTRQHGTGAFDVQGALPDIADPRVSFVKGWFQNTLRPMLQGFTPHSRLVIHNDSDLYASTLYVLATFDPLIIPGTVLIFDEFCVAQHEFRAWADYLAAFNRRATALAMTEDFATQTAFVFE
jgi:hypothetical protein